MQSRIAALFALALIFAATAGQAQNASPDKTTLPGPFGPPSWDTQYPAKDRFLVLDQFNDEAVLDRETGLVWQKTVPAGTCAWTTAMPECRGATIGNRRGWRLPSYEEMSTLLDPKHSSPALPANNPFENFLPTDVFWTATTDENHADDAYQIYIAVANTFAASFKTNALRIWCVRGGQSTQNPF